MIKYRNLLISDYDEVSLLWNSINGMGLRSLDDSREGIERYLKRNPSTGFVAADDSKIVGCIMCGHDGRRGYIYHTCVLPQYRGQGIASRLVQLACEALKAENINKCALVCFTSNELGNAFWKSSGWEQRTDLNYFNLSFEQNNK